MLTLFGCRRIHKVIFSFFLGLCLSANFIYANTALSKTTFKLESPDFKQDELIPDIFTCDGQNISPELNWGGEPEGTKSFVLIVEDPDAVKGVWDHWIIYNIPMEIHHLDKPLKKLPEGAILGTNSAEKTEYHGPCPPDKKHRYFFKLYALDTILENKGSLKKEPLLKLMESHVLSKTELMGVYDLKKRR